MNEATTTLTRAALGFWLFALFFLCQSKILSMTVFDVDLETGARNNAWTEKPPMMRQIEPAPI